MMGLSSLGEPKYKDKIKLNLFRDYNNLKLNLKYFNHHKNNYSYNFLGEPNQLEHLTKMSTSFLKMILPQIILKKI